ncbi:enterochelin esterase domain-containing protein [Streptomyces cyaneofuscatus]|uniref:enterochelin esterase domain-containing protein n=1 Tax=Streptomyces cyaneofuscatus TaxID=66883 RepID=UPI00365E5C24
MSDCTDVDAAPRPVTGPRIARLARQLEAAGTAEARDALTEAFWAEAARTGTPLVEELDDAPGHRAVTFLWRGHRATRRVLLMAPGITDPERLAGSLLHHLPGTDVWYLGHRLRADHRGSYRMVADISAGPAPADPALLQRRLLALRAHGGADPLNPARIPVRWRDAQDSVFALPEAPPQPWAARRPAVARGGVERHAVAVLDALIADGVLPPLAVLAAVPYRPAYEPGGAGPAAPAGALRRGHVVRPARPPGHVVAGQGLGGMTALYAGLTRPERFGAVVAQSPSLWWRPGLEPGAVAPDAVGTPWLATLAAGLRDGPPGGARGAAVHFDVGLHEGALAEHTEALQAVLRARGHRVTRNLHNGGHDYACWRGFLADALVELVGTGLDVNAAESQGGTGPAGRSAVCSAGLPGRPAAR